MSDSHWYGSGPEFSTRWGRRQWRLKVDEDHPGLYWTDGHSSAKLLALDHVASDGFCGEGTFNGSTLRGSARHQARVEATFVPPGWDGLTIRATWIRTSVRDGVDLEVQISTTSLSELTRVEVGVFSRWGGAIADKEPVLASRVEPRDTPSAGLSYDGRESAATLQGLTTLPVPAISPHRLAPRIFAPPNGDDTYYIEMVQPNDCARRIIGEPVGKRSARCRTLSTRYGLFGHHLEKGVVLRARLRGLWIRSQTPDVNAQALCEEFLREPPPLGP